MGLRQNGTRLAATLRKEHPSGRSETRAFTRDLGLKDNVTASSTFTASNGRITCANGTFTGKFFVGETIVIQSVNLNNGRFVVTGLDGVNAAYLTLDPAPKDEGPLSATIRSA